MLPGQCPSQPGIATQPSGCSIVESDRAGGWVVLSLVGLAASFFHGLATANLLRDQLKYLLAATSTLLPFLLIAGAVQLLHLCRNRQETWPLANSNNALCNCCGTEIFGWRQDSR